MPNNVTNVIKFDCKEERFIEIAEELKRDGSYLGSVDFNKLLPMPQALDIPSGSLGITGYRMYKEYLTEVQDITSQEKREEIWNSYASRSEDAKEALELGKQYNQNIEDYGAPTWYEWCCDNWGTKWNAYECEKADRANKELKFETAWSAIPALIKKMSEKYPDVTISYSWADEDIGRNVGELVCMAGKIKDINIPEQGSKDAYEMSARVIGFELAAAGFKLTEDGKTYQYVSKWDD